MGTGHSATGTSRELLTADLPWGRKWCVPAAWPALCRPLPVLPSALAAQSGPGPGWAGLRDPARRLAAPHQVSPPRPTSDGGGASPPCCGRGGRAEGSAQGRGVSGKWSVTAPLADPRA